LHNTKNGDKREVPINEYVKTVFIETRKNPQGDYIFCKADGTPFGDIKTGFFTALKKSGIKDFHFHDLRHTAASHLVMSGVDLNTVREILGHKSLQMTLRYSHLSPSHKKQAVDTLSKWMDTIWTPSTKDEKVNAESKITTV
jgi:integrase